MTLEEVDKIINDLRQQIPSMQMQLHQAENTALKTRMDALEG